MSYYNQQQAPVGVPPPQGYPPEGYAKDAYPPPGYPAQGYPPQGYPPAGGYPPQYGQPQGYPPQQQQQQQSTGPSFMEGWESTKHHIVMFSYKGWNDREVILYDRGISTFKELFKVIAGWCGYF